jgi:hypothetical protein
MTTPVATLLILTAALMGRWWAPPAVTRYPARALDSNGAPVAIGIITFAIMTWAWGSLHPVPIIHDEASYLLQAKIFATFHWTAAGRPLPEFFEQYHVFVTPQLVSKYPPGHSILMVPGIWVGLPTLMPTLFIAITGSVVFILTRRVANPWVALMTWVLWVTAPGVLTRLPSYMSESTSGMLWLFGWWVLLAWRDTGRRRWLLLVTACICWGAVTRPITWLLYAIPAAVVILPGIVRRRAWADLGWASLVGCAGIGFIVLWCLHTTGHPFVTPYALYSKIYFPDDVMGFGATMQSPLRPLPDDMRHFLEWVRTSHSAYTVDRLPHNLVRRLVWIGRDMWGSWRMALLPFAILGLTAISAEVAFALASAVVLILGYLTFGHAATWTVYYLEIQPVLALVTALGLWRFIRLAGMRRFEVRQALAAPLAAREAFVCLFLVLAFLPGFSLTMRQTRDRRAADAKYYRTFHAAVAKLPDKPAILFVRYAPTHDPHVSLVVNEPDLARTRVWIVHDLGAEDFRLVQLAPNRTPYLFDDVSQVIKPIDRTELAARYRHTLSVRSTTLPASAQPGRTVAMKRAVVSARIEP